VEIIYIILLSILLLAGMVVIFFNIAGTFIIVGSAFLFGLLTGFREITLNFCLLLLGIALALEIVEGLLGSLLAKKFGGSKWAMIGAIVGGTAGAILGTPVAPVLGTLLGGFLGAFGGALLLEWVSCGNFEVAFKAGLGALCGAIGGKITKIIVAVVMTIMVYVKLFA